MSLIWLKGSKFDLFPSKFDMKSSRNIDQIRAKMRLNIGTTSMMYSFETETSFYSCCLCLFGVFFYLASCSMVYDLMKLAIIFLWQYANIVSCLPLFTFCAWRFGRYLASLGLIFVINVAVFSSLTLISMVLFFIYILSLCLLWPLSGYHMLWDCWLFQQKAIFYYTVFDHALNVIILMYITLWLVLFPHNVSILNFFSSRIGLYFLFVQFLLDLWCLYFLFV